jgi:tRNA(fMet)-specific endonuclease VapC
MTTFLLDTNAVIELLNKRVDRIERRIALEALAGHAVVTSSIVIHELWFGAFKSTHTVKNEARLNDFLSGPLKTLQFGDPEAKCAGEIRNVLRAAGNIIGPYDILIAGHALAVGATVVTANTKEFIRVPRLSVADWSK